MHHIIIAILLWDWNWLCCQRSFMFLDCLVRLSADRLSLHMFVREFFPIRYRWSLGLRDELIRFCWPKVKVTVTSCHPIIVNAISQERIREFLHIGRLHDINVQYDSRMNWWKFGLQRSRSQSPYKTHFDHMMTFPQRIRGKFCWRSAVMFFTGKQVY